MNKLEDSSNCVTITDKQPQSSQNEKTVESPRFLVNVNIHQRSEIHVNIYT